MTGVLFAGGAERWAVYEGLLTKALAEAGLTDVTLSPDLPPEAVNYAIYAPVDEALDFSVFPHLRAVMCLWAGVEGIVKNQTITVPLTRMVDVGLTQGMVEWVTGHVLRYHLGIDHNLAMQDGVWEKAIPPLAQDRKVSVLGCGALGTACLKALTSLGFDAVGWSRSPKVIDGVRTVNGWPALEEVLRRAEIVVLLVPLTPETENVLNSERLSWLPDGAVVLNPGRGALIEDAALLAELPRLGHATLDTFRIEPLPPEHPFWAHPKVTVTPHIASETRPETASQVVVENIRRDLAGEPLLHVVDRDRGY